MSDVVQPQEPGILEAIIAALRNWGSDAPVDERAETARQASEEMSKTLPPQVMPRTAIEKKRAQMQAIDQMLNENR